LEKLNVQIYKIASFEITHLPLIAKVAKTGKPIIMSTGMASLSDIEAAVKTATKNGCKDIVLLKCTSTYPAEPINSNINTIPHLKNLFKTEVGLSDHTKGVGVAIASIALGASVIEKHFTLSRADGGVDSEFSMEPDELKLLVEEVSRAHKAMGDITYGPTNDEKNSLMFRRSIYVAEDIEKGDIFTEKNLRIVRPGDGAKPKLIYDLLGKRSTRQLKKGTPFSLDLMLLR
jgi:N-acetylneuraminate synthase